MGIPHEDFFPDQSLKYLLRLKLPSDRKLRLFAMECHRATTDSFMDVGIWATLESFTRFLDGELTHSEMFDILENATECRDTLLRLCRPTVATTTREFLNETVQLIAERIKTSTAPEIEYLDPRFWDVMCAPIPALDEVRLAWLKDIFGAPEGVFAFPECWQTEHTIGLVQKMYDDRDFRAMPILADALEEAGCKNADILTHCREPGVHVRGCWVVDLLLGKSS